MKVRTANRSTGGVLIDVPSGTPNDRDMQAALCQELRKQRWAFTPTEENVVRDGVVHLRGYIESEEAGGPSS